MTVKELKELLEQFDENKEIVVCGDNRYAYTPDCARDAKLRAFWGKDRSVVCLFCLDQTGRV